MFESILGHEPIKNFLMQILKNEKIPHSFLFAGPSGIGKKTLCFEFAAKLLNTSKDRLHSGHPDFFFYVPDGKSGNHSIESVRTIIDRVYEAPYEAKKRVFIIDDAERMQVAASNALLKTLEEPLESSHLLLISSKPEAFLPTIHSRLMKLMFYPLSDSILSELLKKLSLSPDLIQWADGSIGKAQEIAEHPEVDSARKILFALLEKRPSFLEIFQGIEQIERLLEIEDPLTKVRRTHYLLSMASGFYKKNSPPKNWEENLHKIQNALERNMKLSACLQLFFL